MASLDTTQTSISTGFNAGPQTFTWTHNVGMGNPILILFADIWQDVGGTGTITTATFANIPFVKIDQRASTAMSSELWYLKAPPLGAHTVSVTVTGATDAIKLATACFGGIDQSSPLDTSSFATGASGNPAASITTSVANALVVATLSRFSTTAATTSATSLYNDAVSVTLAAGSYQNATTATGYTDTYTGTSANDWSMLIASFKPAQSGGGIGNIGRYDKVGDGMSRSEVSN